MRLPNYAASVAVALLGVSTHSLAAPPPAPQVTVGADLKLLRFDWEPVAGATYYQLWIKPGGSCFFTVGERILASTTHAEHPIAVHLQDWERTRYIVTACNTSGCTSSAALNPRNLMLDTIGYLKASNTDPDDRFGREVTLSDDGRTLAVSAEHESSGASGVNGDQDDNSSLNSGAVYIFRPTAAGWRQTAYLKPPRNLPGLRFGVGQPQNQRAVALSSDGSIIAIGATSDGGLEGVVYVFRRAGSTWSLSATLRSPAPQSADFFGYSIDMSLDGRTIKVNSLQPQDAEVNHEGRTHIFDRSGSTWVHKVTLAPFHAGDFCSKVRMSGDGLTLVANCFVPHGNVFRAVTLKRVGDAWVHAGDLPLTSFTNEQPLALNFDATAMALTQSGTPNSSVGVYRWDGSTWVREANLSAPSTLPSSGSFGIALAFSRDGKRLAIGDFSSPAGGAGVSNSVQSGTAPHGAVFLYHRNGPVASPWQLRSVVKAPNPGSPNPGQDLFGISVALSGSGRTLAVGAVAEDSNARGIDGNQSNESAPDAGAAYVY